MDKDRIVGSVKQIKGSIKETLGKVVGDTKLQSEGTADQAKGTRFTMLSAVSKTRSETQ